MIEIIEARHIDKGVLQSVVSVKITNWGNFIIKELTVWKKDNGARWINFPNRTYDKDGVKKHMPLMEFEDQAVKKLFEEEFFKVYDKYLVQYPKTAQTTLDKPTWGLGKNVQEEIPF